jgi:hypothetical protein
MYGNRLSPNKKVCLLLTGPLDHRERDAHRQHARGHDRLQPGGEDRGPREAGPRIRQLRHRHRPQPRHQAHQVRTAFPFCWYGIFF